MENTVPRNPRLHVPGGFYHVIARGNDRQDIFFDDDDRLRWEQLLCEGLDRHGHRIHAYCWMTNHVHVAIQAGKKPLARFMGSLLSRYAKEFNRKTGRSGHVFERRYRAILVQEDNYLLELVRYIHQNPQRAGIVEKIRDYRWSSHRAYAGTDRPPWLRTDLVFSQFSPNLQSAIHRYLDFVGEKQSLSVTELLRAGLADDHRTLGDDVWVKEVLEDSSHKLEIESLDELIARVCQQNDVTEAQLASRSRSRTNAKLRAEIALVATKNGIASVTEVARRFRRSQPVISRALNRLWDQLA